MKVLIVLSFFVLTACASSEVKDGKVMSAIEGGNIEMKIVELTIPAEDYGIATTYVIPSGEGPFPLVLMLHGLGGNREEGGMFARYAQLMVDRGIASIRMDFVGCGESKLPFRENSITNMIADSYTVLDWAVENLNIDTKRLGLLGYSMGGRMALIMTAEENPFTDRVSPYTAHVFLAPGTRSFPEDFDVLHEQAKADGYYPLPWFGETLELGRAWFDDMVYANKFVQNIQGRRENSLIVVGDKDALMPTNEKAARIIDAGFAVIPEAAHGFGFWSDQPEVRDGVVGEVSDFFIENL